MADGADAPHLPRAALIDAYGNGGFRFAGMSHRGSLLCLPVGIWAWPISSPGDIDAAALAPIFAAAGEIEPAPPVQPAAKPGAKPAARARR